MACIFEGVYGKDCGGHRVSLSSCDADTSGHLFTLKISDAELTECDLIISRGRALLGQEIDKNNSICAVHREELGTRWRRFTRTCQYPTHSGSGKGTRHIYHKMYLELLEMNSTHHPPPIGAKLCEGCRKYHQTAYRDYQLQLESSSMPMSSQSSQPVSIMSSQDSVNSWKGQTVSLEEINSALAVLCKAAGVDTIRLNSRLSTSWNDLGRTAQYQYRLQLRQLERMTQELVAPGQGELLTEDDAEEPASTSESSGKIVDNLVHIYSTSETWQQKRQILSILCSDFTKSDLLSMIPGVTVYAVDAARHHAALSGAGTAVKATPTVRDRLSQVKVDHFLDFLMDPVYLKSVSYGDRELRLSTGQVLTIPNMLRTVHTSHLVENYQTYCFETKFECLPRATLFRILQDCQASYSTSLQGLDNISARGAEAFNQLQDICQRLQLSGQSVAWSRDIKELITASQEYLKVHYRGHISLFSKCPHHCIAYSLSDPKDKDYQTACSHEHSEVCPGCCLLDRIQHELETAVADVSSDDLREELVHDLTSSVTAIHDYRSHIMRCVNQDRCRVACLDSLQQNQAMVVCDWAMKFLPVYYREKQQDFFGKRGKSWHVSAVIHREDGDLKVRTFVHIFEQTRQDWQSVAAILLNTLATIKKQLSQITEVYLRSDNAGCYKCGALLALLPAIEQQSGPLRQRIRRYVSEGHDVDTAQKMKEALDDGGGVKSVQVAIAHFSPKPVRNPKWIGIQSLMNFRYDSSHETVSSYKAYDIGPGKSVKTATFWSETPPILQLDIVQNFSLPTKPTGDVIGKRAKMTATSTASETEDHELPDFILPCCDPQCDFVAHSYEMLDTHIATEKHIMTSHDKIMLKWKDRLESVTSAIKAARSSTTDDSLTGAVPPPQGWALKGTIKASHYSQEVKAYLQELFETGRRTGRKSDPADVARDLKSARMATGAKRFKSDDWLSASQVASYFSRLAAAHHTQSAPDSTTTAENDDSDARAVEREELRNSLLKGLTV
ncbi:uncharacterized protein LOC127531379 [Acanthochromis polyacanthus]|uniref:uncharacterized protein LOC127531379 n=1 Tax=Acanthochromis polyacanthus TaxID=80966 RepID=UPI0022342C01|nr:uncharacterized protein LOC127531379 [Acanthochromis polyacanthus]